MNKRITVTHESKSGRNQNFHDNKTGKDMSRAVFVKEIELGKYLRYHIRIRNGLKTPTSNPDGKSNNNLD